MNKPDFLIIPSQIAFNKNLEPLDLKLYGVLYWLEHLKDGKITASNQRLAELCDSKALSISDCLTRLEKEGFIERKFKDLKSKHRLGIKTLIKFSKTLSADTDTLSADTERGLSADTEQNNKSNRISKRKDISLAGKPAGNEISEIIYLFKEVNPLIGKYYGNISQRAAIQRMLKEFGREKLEGMIKVLPAVNSKPYWPKSTTPCQLENNIAVYKAKNAEEKNKGQKIKEVFIINNE